MGIQIILCVEADKHAKTDAIYINDTIKWFYEVGKSTKIRFIYMNGKTNYKSRHVLSQIQKYSKEYNIGVSKVIYCVDLDLLETNPVQVKENEEIREFATKNNYEMAWFCHDIEEVYLGASVEKRIKKEMAIDFKKKELVSKVDPKKLLSKKTIKGTSNLLLVLDKYLNRRIK
jgi:hypothetical protein